MTFLVFNFMKTFSTSARFLTLSLLITLSVLLVPVHKVNAKAVSWNTTVLSQFYYCWNGSIYGNGPASCTTSSAGGWAHALDNPNITISYDATILNTNTNTPVNDTDSVPVGTNLHFSTTPHSSADISWFGTGYGADSPNGDWVTGAATPVYPPICYPKDQVTLASSGTLAFPVYIPLEINPPSGKTISVSANLSCSVPTTDSNQTTSRDCVVTAAGPISAVFNIPATYGKFYYRYTVAVTPPPRCQGNDASLRTLVGSSFVDSYGVQEASPPFTSSINASDYQISVPAQSITFSLTAPAANNPPNAPSITKPPSCTTGTAGTYSFSATDPNNDTLRYGVDWNNDGSVDQWVPPSGYVSSGTSQSTTHTWNTSSASR